MTTSKPYWVAPTDPDPMYAVGQGDEEITKPLTRERAREIRDLLNAGKPRALRDLCEQFRQFSADPRDAATMLRLIASRMHEDAAELQHAHQDKTAGRPWTRAATLLERAAAQLESV